MGGRTAVFGDVEVDLDAHEIRRAGEVVAVEPQVFDVLAHLIEHRNRLVAKTELLDEVWGNRFVSESALTSRIKAARRAVGDNGRDQRVIRTVHGRGYRFVAELEGEAAAAGSAPVLPSLVEDLAEGQGRALLVAAPPGRVRRELLYELYQDAVGAGLLAARGRTVSQPAMGGVVDVVDELVQRRPELVEALPGGCRSELDRVLLGGAPTTIGRFQLAARELLRLAAEDGGVVVVLQDLELADQATLTLVEQWALLTRRVPFALVVGHGDPSMVAGFEVVEAGGSVDASVLHGLPDEVVDVLTRLAVRGPVVEPSAFRDAAGGTPEAADRILEVAVAAGVLEPEGDGHRFRSPELVDALLARLGPLRRAELLREADDRNLLQEARDAFARRDWVAAYEGFARAEDLEPSDLDAYAEAANWIGRGEDIAELYKAAYRAHLAVGARHRAGYSAFMVSLHLRLQGDAAPADGWLSRAQRVLADQPEGSEHGYPLYLETARLMGVDLDEAVASAQRMQDLGRRFGDETLEALGVFFEGRARIKQAKVQEGLALLDEAMAAALSDTLEPMWTGAIYCGLLDACHELGDPRRAHQWTEATRRWVEPLPIASLYPGICRVHTAEMLQQQGAWEEAEAAALAVSQEMAEIDVFVVADALYEVGEIRRRRGDVAGAEEAYGRAHAAGRDPQPGLALLRLAQDRVEAASSSIAAAIAAFGGSRLERAPLHAAQVTIALKAQDLELAEASAVEVAQTAATFASPGLAAVGARCTGAVALAKGDAAAALGSLRVAQTAWQELEAPHELACTRVLVAQAYRALGDGETADRELSAARATFERLGASSDLCALDGLPLEG